jgi:hypothetical protein
MKICQALGDIVQLIDLVGEDERLGHGMRHTILIAYEDDGECSPIYLRTLPKGIQGETMALEGLGNVVKSIPRRGTMFLSAREK